MIYPSKRAILLAAAVAPLALVLGVAVPQYWFAGLALLAFLLALCGADALIGPGIAQASLLCDAPEHASVGSQVLVQVQVGFAAALPSRAELALGASTLLRNVGPARQKLDPARDAGAVSFTFHAVRRGKAFIETGWLRWPAPLGLVWKQKRVVIDRSILVTPDLRPVRAKAVQLMHREAMHGTRAQLRLGEGSEFEALAEYRAGMDRRSIDWKQSARHNGLLAKEFRTERNNNIIMAIDAGRSMSEPLSGVPRVDRAVSAALLTAYVALRDGDRVGFFGFDSHPRVSSRALSGPRAFATLQRVAGEIDYSGNETNYTLALATLASGLHRRSLIIVFTEFADPIAAELMLAAVGPLLKRHLLLFIVMQDEELDSFASADPMEADDVVRAVAAASLLRQRKLVITRLRHLGVHVVEAGHEEIGAALVRAYSDFKRRNLI